MKIDSNAFRVFKISLPPTQWYMQDLFVTMFSICSFAILFHFENPVQPHVEDQKETKHNSEVKKEHSQHNS